MKNTKKILILCSMLLLLLVLNLGNLSAEWTPDLSNGLYGYYTMDETTGTITIDSTGTNNLTETGAVIKGRDGVLDKGYYYDGTSYSRKAIVNGGGTTTMSFCGWINHTVNEDKNFFGQGQGGDNNQFIISHRTTKNFFLATSGAVNNLEGTKVCQTNEWCFVCGVLDGTNMSLYVNGTIDSSKIVTNNIIAENLTFATYPSQYSAGNNITAMLDEWGVWNRTLTGAEISQLYNNGAGITYPLTSVTLNSPSDNYISLNTSVDFNCTGITTGGDTTNVSLYVDNILNYTHNGSSPSLELFHTVSGLSYSSHQWYCEASGDKGYQNGTIYTVNVSSWRENAKTYNSSTIENSMETFTTNITYDSSIYTIANAQLFYNGTTYTATKTSSGSDVIFSRTITIPVNNIENNMSFKWLYSLTGISGTTYFNSSEINQYVNRTNASILGGPYNNNYINFTIYDEETLAIINASFSITMDYGLSSFIRSLSYGNNSQTLSTFSFGFEPPDKNYLVKGTAEYSRTGYETRTYTLPSQTLSNTTTNINLYLLNSSKSTTFIIAVRDSAYSKVEGAVVHVQRYYAETDTWITTEIVTTNYDGKTIGHFVTEDVDYRFLVYVDGVLKLTTGTTKVFAESSPYTITLTLEGDVPFQTFENLTDLEYSLTYSKTTETFTYSYSDDSSTADGGRLIVVRANYGNSTQQTICDVSSTETSAVLTCDISAESNGTYYAFAYNERTTATTLVDTLIIEKSTDVVDTIGTSGVVWAFFLILGIVMIGLYKPAVAVVFSVGAVIMVGLIGLVSIPALALSAIIIIGVILIWTMKQ